MAAAALAPQPPTLKSGRQRPHSPNGVNKSPRTGSLGSDRPDLGQEPAPEPVSVPDGVIDWEALGRGRLSVGPARPRGHGRRARVEGSADKIGLCYWELGERMLCSPPENLARTQKRESIVQR